MEEQTPGLRNKLSPEEVIVVQFSLSATIEDLQTTMNDPRLNDKAKKEMRGMLKSLKSAHMKIAQASGKMLQLDPYVEGDEKEFLKQ